MLAVMRMRGGPVPRPPDGLRPAQLGVARLGRVIIGDIGATVADLAVRHLIDVREGSGEDEDAGWLLTVRDSPAPLEGREPLLGYERTLLQGLSSRRRGITMSAALPDLPDLLADTRREIIRDAVRRGWLHRLRTDKRTPSAEELTRRIRRFQGRLREFAAAQDRLGVLEGSLLPYALQSGLLGDSDLALARFTRHWVTVLSPLPGWHPPGQPRYDPLTAAVPKSGTDLNLNTAY